MSAHRHVLSARVKTSAAVLATGIGAAAAAGALASPAAAAGGDSWEAVRQCESGGNYSTNTGNGYYGAYQFNMQTWRGLGMSGRPSDASPAVQDQAARRLAGQYGMKPWPNCGKRYGGHTPASGGGSHHVRAHSAPATSVRVHPQHSTASGYQATRATRPTRPQATRPTRVTRANGATRGTATSATGATGGTDRGPRPPGLFACLASDWSGRPARTCGSTS